MLLLLLSMLLMLMMGQQINAKYAVAIVFFFYNPTANNNGWVMYTVEAEVDVEAETEVGTEAKACILYDTEQKLLVVVIPLLDDSGIIDTELSTHGSSSSSSNLPSPY